MFSSQKNQTFDEERMTKLRRLAEHDLLKSVFIENYTVDEVAEAKRRYDEYIKNKPTPSLMDNVYSTFHRATNTKPAIKPSTPIKPIQNHEEDEISCSTCTLF